MGGYVGSVCEEGACGRLCVGRATVRVGRMGGGLKCQGWVSALEGGWLDVLVAGREGGWTGKWLDGRVARRAGGWTGGWLGRGVCVWRVCGGGGGVR